MQKSCDFQTPVALAAGNKFSVKRLTVWMHCTAAQNMTALTEILLVSRVT